MSKLSDAERAEIRQSFKRYMEELEQQREEEEQEMEEASHE